MSSPQEGEILIYRRTGCVFRIERVTGKLAVLRSQDGLTQIMTPMESLDLVFKRIPPVASFRKDLNPRSKSPHSAQKSDRLKAL